MGYDPDQKYDKPTTPFDEIPTPRREEIHRSAERRRAEIEASASASHPADRPATEQPPSPTMSQNSDRLVNVQGEHRCAGCASPGAAAADSYFPDVGRAYAEELDRPGINDSTGDLHATEPAPAPALTPIPESSSAEGSGRPGVTRQDTDTYEDNPSTSPRPQPTDRDASLPPTPGSPFSPTRISPSTELHVSPYVSEHDVPTTPSPQPPKTPSPPASPAPAHEEHQDKEGEKKVGIVDKIAQMLGKSDIKDSKESKE